MSQLPVFPPNGGKGVQQPPFYRVHAAQDSTAMHVPRHKQLQGAQSPPLLFNPGGNTELHTQQYIATIHYERVVLFISILLIPGDTAGQIHRYGR